VSHTINLHKQRRTIVILYVANDFGQNGREDGVILEIRSLRFSPPPLPSFFYLFECRIVGSL
jgi:hypothetical protein